MATFNLAINYPDDQGTRIMTALKTHWTTQDAEGNDVVPTNAEVVEKLRQAVVNAVRDIVLRIERDAATTAAADGITEADVT
jgi:hypothetical protein